MSSYLPEGTHSRSEQIYGYSRIETEMQCPYCEFEGLMEGVQKRRLLDLMTCPRCESEFEVEHVDP